jgi:replication factor C subunit 1
MDEVDGMSSGDRGGLAELCQLIKTSKFPIICIANDKYKVRSLDNHCLRIGFRRPTPQQIQAKLAQIAFKEGITAPESVRKQLADECHGDVRQAINMLQLWSIGGSTQITFGMNRKKDPTLGPFDAVPSLLSDSLQRFDEKLERFFVDYSLVPLFIYENYLSIIPERGLQRLGEQLRKRTPQPTTPVPSVVQDARTLRLFADAADSISLGDVLERGVRRDQHWELLPGYGAVSTIRPCATLKGRFAPSTASWVGGGLQFPQWLGKNSSTNKHLRLLQEVQSTLALHTGGVSHRATRLDYCSVLHLKLTDPLKSGMDGISDILSTMEAYQMQKENRDAILELQQVNKDQSKLDQVPTNVKSALTRQINKAHWTVGSRAGPAKSNTNFSTAEQPNDPELGEIFVDGEIDESGDTETVSSSDRLIKEKKKVSAKTKGSSKKKT